MTVRGLARLVAISAGLAIVPGAANAQFIDLTVDETVTPGTGAAGFAFIADKMSALYRGRITFASDPNLGSTTYTLSAVIDFSACTRC